MILDKIGIVWRRATGAEQRAAARTRAERWAAADERDALAVDLLRMGRVLAMSPIDPASDMLAADAAQLAYEAGRRDLAIELLAMMSVTPDDVRSMMERDRHE